MIWQHWFSITHIISNGRLFKHVLSLVLKWVASIHHGYNLYLNFPLRSIEMAVDAQTAQHFGLNILYMHVAFYGESDFGLYWYCELRMAILHLHIYNSNHVRYKFLTIISFLSMILQGNLVILLFYLNSTSFILIQQQHLKHNILFK